MNLTKEHIDFLVRIAICPGCKLNGGVAWGGDGDIPLWKALEANGLIESVGSYKWVLKNENLLTDAVTAYLTPTPERSEQ